MASPTVADATTTLTGLNHRRFHQVLPGEVVNLGDDAYAVVYGVAYIRGKNAMVIVGNGGKVYTAGDARCSVCVCSGAWAATTGAVVDAQEGANVQQYLGAICPRELLRACETSEHNRVTLLPGSQGHFGYGSIVYVTKEGAANQSGS